MARSDGRAVVVGASMAGLLTARVLTEFFPQVTVVDRDDLTGGPVPRRGVPQSRHSHALLSGGVQALQSLFPDLVADLLQHGAEICDFQADSRLFASGRLLRQQPSDLVAIAVSRPLLEDRVRQAVLSTPGVAVLAPAQLVDLRAEDGRVTGVRVRQGEADTDVSAELVVDATGRGSHTPTWLAEHGLPRPVESTVDVGLTYASWVFPRRTGDLDGARFLLIPPTPEVPRVGSALAIEGGRWMVGSAGYRGDAAPLDLDGLRRFAATLPARDLADLIAGREPLEPPRAHRFPASLRHHYERLPVFPEGLLVTGDALSSFNPIYGQGMTIAAFEALALRDELAAGGPDLPRRFFAHAARLIDVAWDLAAGSDLALPMVPGRRSLRTRLVNAYVHRIGLAAAGDPQVGRTFIRVVNLLDPPTALIRPAMLARVAAGGRNSRRQPRSVP
jgi:2-polyprenyl-6-methoxyphenol hydroxylase-like FAD-dependent oxidoreductase